MAISFTRLLCRNNLNAHQFRGLFTSKSLGISTTAQERFAVEVCETHAQRNERLKRPLSPHLTIYKLQLTTTLSITHRATGIALAYYAMGAGLTELLLPGGFNCFIESVDALCLSTPILFMGKLMIALPATFHYFNGIRHLCWDLGMFLSIKQVYSTGWTVFGLSVITALPLAAMF
ncbi:hypothetical protein PV325_001609 [Microctonus aethiopoides]|uniref:Succinate dehydrogenase cytochrome b560 subunit, mitochondrial n=1 Tax=Microctonus aethiopoides TaxID=144406 RepID=A0AA39FBA6_9HYME|nr:hypothetical protein PV325_001609 [Microctonus aethiopoides]KAK0092907.1 hypothetical protein PV326_000356 [Microctonus aethiopoides]KAK0166311.1 hypothetical protein PV328_004744 [Microctonus aethiopoides]